MKPVNPQIRRPHAAEPVAGFTRVANEADRDTQGAQRGMNLFALLNVATKIAF
jgi:hypothetical protein